jgi:hypothetical protein
MLEEIYNHPDLFEITRQPCVENGVGGHIARSLLVDGHLDSERVVILKIDAFYDSSRMHNPPPSPDCLVIVRCCDGSYSAYVIELRNVNSVRGVPRKEMLAKFKTALNDFIGERFKDIFWVDGQFRIKVLRLFLVTDPYAVSRRGMTGDDYRKYLKGTALDAFSSMEPLSVGGLVCPVEPILPNPIIQEC